MVRLSRDDVWMSLGIWYNSSEAVMLKMRKSIFDIIPDARNVLNTNIEVILSSTKI